jgi:hypothetical protein
MATVVGFYQHTCDVNDLNDNDMMNCWVRCYRVIHDSHEWTCDMASCDLNAKYAVLRCPSYDVREQYCSLHMKAEINARKWVKVK